MQVWGPIDKYWCRLESPSSVSSIHKGVTSDKTVPPVRESTQQMLVDQLTNGLQGIELQPYFTQKDSTFFIQVAKEKNKVNSNLTLGWRSYF